MATSTAYSTTDMAMLKTNTDLYSSSVGFSLRMRVCEKPLSTTTSAMAVKKVMMAITPKSSGMRSRATTMLTTICSSIDPTFSAMLHATPAATLSFSSPLPIRSYQLFAWLFLSRMSPTHAISTYDAPRSGEKLPPTLTRRSSSCSCSVSSITSMASARKW